MIIHFNILYILIFSYIKLVFRLITIFILGHDNVNKLQPLNYFYKMIQASQWLYMYTDIIFISRIVHTTEGATAITVSRKNTYCQ